MRASGSEASLSAAGLFAGTLLSLLAVGRECPALPLPTTARSQSVQAPSLLLEDPVAGFLFPQAGVRGVGELGSFGSTSRVSHGTGACLAVGRHTFRYDLWSAVPALEWDIRNLPAFQVGWSTVFRGTDVGLAYAWANEAEKTRDLQEGRNGPFLGRSDRRSFLQVHVRRVSLGVGRGGDGFRVDLAFSLQREALEYDWFDEFRPLDRPTFSRETRSFRVRDDYRPGGAMRVAWRLAGGNRLRGFATYQETTQEITDLAREESSSTGPTLTDTYEDRSWGREWSCGAAFESGLPRRGRWMAHVSYVVEGDRWVYDLHSWAWDRESRERETLALGLSGWMPVPGGLELRAGGSIRRLRTTNRAEIPWSIQRTRVERSDARTHTFGWGLARSFESFEIVGALNTPPPPLHPFVLLDIRLRL